MFKQKFWLTVFFIYQLFSTALIATGAWPVQVVYVNLVIQLLAILAFDLEYAVYSVILSIPFYLVLPNPKLDTFSAWRVTLVFLFIVFLFKKKIKHFAQISFYKWDKWLAVFIVVAAISVLSAGSKTLGIKKLAFGINIYLLYVVILNVIKNKEQILRSFKVSLVSLFTIVALGFVQLFASYTTQIYYFWQYWATIVSRYFYGATFSDTSTYSNSWFSFSNHVPSLRMFSILPDSHAFAVICMFAIIFAVALVKFAKSGRQRAWLWVIVAFADLGLVFSGTRGMWAGIIAPAIIGGYFYSKHFGREILKPVVIPILIFVLAIVISPVVQKGVNAMVKQNTSNFLQRAESIYDLGESSNAGRLQIWQYTLAHVVLPNPLLGIGYGNFAEAITSQQEKEFNLPKQYITAHSLYLDVLAETGLIGFLAFAFYFLRLLEIFLQFFKKHYLFHDDGFVVFAVTAGFYLTWLLAYSLVDGTIMNDRVLMYFFIVLALSANIIRVYSIE